MTATMDEARIREATATDVPVIRQIVDEAYRRYIPRIGKPPAPMLDAYAARVSHGVAWVIEERSAIAGVIVLLPEHEHLLLDNIAVARRSRARGWAGVCWRSRRPKRCAAGIAKSASIRTKR